MSIKNFRSQMANDVFLGDNTKAARRLPRSVWAAAARRLDILHTAQRLMDLAAIPGFHFRKADDGSYYIRINNKYRVTFRYEDGEAYDVDIEEAEDTRNR